MSDDGGPLIHLRQVSKVYPAHGEAPEVWALRKVTLDIGKGTRVAIRGESGSGKSTLLNVLGGLGLRDERAEPAYVTTYSTYNTSTVESGLQTALGSNYMVSQPG